MAENIQTDDKVKTTNEIKKESSKKTKEVKKNQSKFSIEIDPDRAFPRYAEEKQALLDNNKLPVNTRSDILMVDYDKDSNFRIMKTVPSIKTGQTKGEPFVVSHRIKNKKLHDIYRKKLKRAQEVDELNLMYAVLE